MAVELSPVETLDIDPELVEFAPENYCANCTHFETQIGDIEEESDQIPYCQQWEDTTRVEPGMVCSEYVPEGYE